MDERLPHISDQASDSTESSFESSNILDSIKSVLELPQDAQEAIFRDLQRQRQINSYERNNESTAIDNAIVELLENGEIELASRLIVPSYSEHRPMQRAIARYYDNNVTASAAMSRVNDIIAQKVQAFSERLQEHFTTMEPDTLAKLTTELKMGVADPESALDVPAEVWSDFFTLPEQIQAAILRTPGELGAAIDMAAMLEQGGLSQYAAEFMPRLAELSASERKEYIDSMNLALQQLRTDYPDLPIGKWDISYLSSHREPHAALNLAIQTFPHMQPTMAASVLETVYPGKDGALAYVPEEITAILPDLNAALLEVFQSDHETPHFIERALKLGPEVVQSVLPDFIRIIKETSDMREGVDAHFNSKSDINGRSTNALQLSREEIKAIFSINDKAEVTRYLKRFSMRQSIANTEWKLVKSFLERVRDRDRGVEVAKPPDLSGVEKIELRGLDKFFNDLGIPEGLQCRLFEACMSYSPVGYALNVYKKENPKDLTDSELNVAALDAARIFYEQLAAIQSYCEQYGTAELVELNEIFGIVNFTRATAEQFHNQLMRWKTPDLPVKNINVACTEDHNFAFGGTAAEFFSNFTEDGSFYFEAATLPQLSRVFVWVGGRERAAGRIPEEISQVKNVVLSGHGSPQEISFSEGNGLNVEAFATAAQSRAQFVGTNDSLRPNDYSQYIGKAYRIILEACSTGKTVPDSINISEVLHREYRVPVEAPPRNSAGYQVTERGNISFKVVDDNDEFVYVDGVRHE